MRTWITGYGGSAPRCCAVPFTTSRWAAELVAASAIETEKTIATTASMERFIRTTLLLPQPGGFEGFLAIEEDPLAGDLAVADAEEGGELAHDLDAALATHGRPAMEGHQHVTGFEDALDLPVGFGPGLPHLRSPAPD